MVDNCGNFKNPIDKPGIVYGMQTPKPEDESSLEEVKNEAVYGIKTPEPENVFDTEEEVPTTNMVYGIKTPDEPSTIEIPGTKTVYGILTPEPQTPEENKEEEKTLWQKLQDNFNEVIKNILDKINSWFK
ncbi:hypothetical protein II906_03860 [bacterium]|nr:hypothetical protein [bacterium]